MAAFACLVSQFIGWRFPLAATSGSYLNPTVGMASVVVAEVAWFSTNVYTIIILRQHWKVPVGYVLQFVAAIVCVSCMAQVLLGHMAIRDLRTFLETIPH